MAFKFLAVCTLFAVANAGLQQPINPVYHAAPINFAQPALFKPVLQQHASYAQPALIKTVQQPAIVKTYAQPAFVKEYAQPAVVKSYAQPTIVKSYAQPTYVKQVEDYDAPANYEFSYSVHDSHTGDVKSQHETRHGDQVQGQYSLLDADGHQRIVDYTADDHNGFNAVVRREPTNVKVVQPVQKVLAQPVYNGHY